MALLGMLGPEGLVVEVAEAAQVGLTCGVGLPVAQFQNSSHPEASGPIFSRSARFQNQGLRATQIIDSANYQQLMESKLRRFLL